MEPPHQHKRSVSELHDNLTWVPYNGKKRERRRHKSGIEPASVDGADFRRLSLRLEGLEKRFCHFQNELIQLSGFSLNGVQSYAGLTQQPTLLPTPPSSSESLRTPTIQNLEGRMQQLCDQFRGFEEDLHIKWPFAKVTGDDILCLINNCGARFPTFPRYEHHISHSREQQHISWNNGLKTDNCLRCDRTFSSLKECKRHDRKFHQEAPAHKLQFWIEDRSWSSHPDQNIRIF